MTPLFNVVNFVFPGDEVTHNPENYERSVEARVDYLEAENAELYERINTLESRMERMNAVHEQIVREAEQLNFSIDSLEKDVDNNRGLVNARLAKLEESLANVTDRLANLSL